MILLDTTVLVYAVGGDHDLREPAAAIVDAIGRGSAAATTTVEVIQEFTHVRSRRRPRADAADVAADFATLLTPLTPVGVADLRAGLELFRREGDVGCFDAVLIAVARRIGATLVTADRALYEAFDDAEPLTQVAARVSRS